MLGTNYYLSSLFFVFLGLMDCVTTVVGTQYFGTQELNPLINNLVQTNLPGFVIIKVLTSVSVALIFVLAEKRLIESTYKNTSAFSTARKMLHVTFLGVNLFLAMVVINNILVLIQSAF